MRATLAHPTAVRARPPSGILQKPMVGVLAMVMMVIVKRMISRTSLPRTLQQLRRLRVRMTLLFPVTRIDRFI